MTDGGKKRREMRSFLHIHITKNVCSSICHYVLIECTHKAFVRRHSTCCILICIDIHSNGLVPYSNHCHVSPCFMFLFISKRGFALFENYSLFQTLWAHSVHVKVFCTLYKLFIQGFHRGQYLVKACFWQNDLLEPLISRVILFADDSVVYHLVTSTLDQDQPQQDFLKLQLWEKSWDMVFHPEKCTYLWITRKKKTLNHKYVLHNQTLANLSPQPNTWESVSNKIWAGMSMQTFASKQTKLLASWKGTCVYGPLNWRGPHTRPWSDPYWSMPA